MVKMRKTSNIKCTESKANQMNNLKKKKKLRYLKKES